MTVIAERHTIDLIAREPGYDLLITVDIEDGREVFVARHPALPGCISHGDTPADAERNLVEAREMYLAALRRKNLPVPEPKDWPSRIVQEPPSQSRPSEAVAERRVEQSSWRVTTPKD